MKQYMVEYLDIYGKPRAYAWGPPSKVEEIRQEAARQLALYCEKHSYRRKPPKPEDYRRNEFEFESSGSM